MECSVLLMSADGVRPIIRHYLVPNPASHLRPESVDRPHPRRLPHSGRPTVGQKRVG